MKFVIVIGLLVVIGLPCAVALALAFGGPSTPPVMKRINEPFAALEDSDLPALSDYQARDGTSLAFRHYVPDGTTSKGSVVLLHGSSASSRSMHPLAKAYAEVGYTAYALDIRGHGTSGVRGEIAYIGQLEDDLEDFIHAVAPASPTTLVGFSSGGGFALRIAASQRQRLFSSYLLLSPFISQDAPTYRSDSGGWVRIGLPRYLTILFLNQLGIDAFNHLPVVRYAISDEAKPFLTPAYSFNLAQNYRPKPDYLATIRAANQPLRVVAGQRDQVFRTDRFDDLFQAADNQVPIELLPDIDHVGLILEPQAIDATIDATQALNEQSE